MKKKSLKALKVEVWKIFSEYIRKRDCLLATSSIWYGECFTCGNPKEYHELDAGHYRPKHSGNFFSERGVHAQCRSCNRYKGGMPLEYRRHLVELYGEGADLELEAEARQTKKFTISELETLKKDLRERIKKLEGGNE